MNTTTNETKHTPTLPAILQWCGLMGHRFVTLRPDTEKTHRDGQYSCAMESNDLRSASCWLNGEAIAADWRVFERTKKGWREVFPWHYSFEKRGCNYGEPYRVWWTCWDNREAGRPIGIADGISLADCRAKARAALAAAKE